MIGDRLNTDIQFGQNGGLATLLVLTGTSCTMDGPRNNVDGPRSGVTLESDIIGPSASSVVPDFVTQSLGDLRVLDK